MPRSAVNAPKDTKKRKAAPKVSFPEDLLLACRQVIEERTGTSPHADEDIPTTVNHVHLRTALCRTIQLRRSKAGKKADVKDLVHIGELYHIKPCELGRNL